MENNTIDQAVESGQAPSSQSEMVHVANLRNGQARSLPSDMEHVSDLICDMEDKITELDSCADVIWRLSDDYPKDSGLALMSSQFCAKIADLAKHWDKIFQITSGYSRAVKVKASSAGDAERPAPTA